jgi:hypothetical protein
MEDEDGISLVGKGFVGDHLAKLLLLKVEFGKTVLE